MISKRIILILIIARFSLVTAVQGSEQTNCLSSIPRIMKGKTSKLFSSRTSTLESAANDEAFDKMLVDSSSKPVVVFFSEENSDSCKKMEEYLVGQVKPWKKYVKFLKADKIKCSRIVNSYKVTSFPTIVAREDENDVLRIIDGEDYKEKMKGFIVQRHGTYLESAAPLVLKAEHDDDVGNKIIYAQRAFKNKFVIMFGRESCPQDLDAFNYVQTNAKTVETHANFLIVDIDKCKKSKEIYNITTTPAFEIRERNKEVIRIAGDDYKDELDDCIVPWVPFVAYNDTEYDKQMKIIKRKYTFYIIVFCYDTRSPNNEIMAFVMAIAKSWINKYKTIVVDVATCDKARTNFRLNSSSQVFYICSGQDELSGTQVRYEDKYRIKLRQMTGYDIDG